MNSTSGLEETFDVSRSCRICLNRRLNMSYIFNSSNKEIVDNIAFCTGITLKEEEKLPTKICRGCLNKLTVAHKFKTSCLVSEEMCQKILLDTIKVEILTNKNIEDQFDCVNEDNVTSYEESEKCVHDDPFHLVKEEENVECDYEVFSDGVQKEFLNGLDVRRSSRQKIGSGRQDDGNAIGRNKRGPYKKGTPRMKKFKFTRLVCEPCGLKFKSKRESDDHKQCLHKESYMCEVCGKTFMHRGSHYAHVRSHLPPTHACEHCDYKTANKYDLQKHLRIHLGIKKYQCAVCSACYHTSSNLRDHERRLHEGIRRFACHMCERLFYDRTKLNRHLDSHNDIKRFECEVCHTAFTRRCYWKKHLERQHSVTVPAQRPGRRKNGFVVGDPTHTITAQKLSE